MPRPHISAYVNTFVTRAFRDVADQDYINARICFRYELDLQFMTSAQQAVEKYLKGILIFNRCDTKKLEHSLAAAYAAVRAIDDIPFSFPSAVDKFIGYLDDQASRYFEFSYHVYGERLRQLDETVWHLRRWCQFVRGVRSFEDGTVVELLPLEIQRITDPRWAKQPYKFRLFNGFLEDVLARKSHAELRPFLVWSNSFFSRRKKGSYRLLRHSAANTTVSLYPDILAELEKYVKISKELKRRVASWGA